MDMSKEEYPYINNISDMVSIFENYKEAVLVVSKTGTIIDANKKAVETYGYTYKELLELSTNDLRKDNMWEYNKDGDEFFMGILGIYKDITETKELIKKLQESEERWRFALEGGKFGVWDLELESGKLVHYNNWKKTLGYEEEDIKDTCDGWKSLMHPEDQVEFKKKFVKCIKSGEFSAEVRVRCKNNEYKWVKSKGKISAWKENGEPLRIVGTNEDITDSKYIERELNERYKQMGLLKQEAEAVFKAKSLFLANISKEMNSYNSIG